MKAIKFLPGIALLFVIAACDRTPPSEPSAPAATQASAEATAPQAPKTRSVAVPVLAGQTVSGKHVVEQAGTLSAFGIRIGNYRNKSDGTLRLTLCLDGACQDAEMPLADSRDNDYLVFTLPEPVAVGAGSTLDFTLARQSDDPRNRVAIWVYPVKAGETGLVDPAGTTLDMAPRVSLQLQ